MQHIIDNLGVAEHPSSQGMLAIANRILFNLGIMSSEGDALVE